MIVDIRCMLPTNILGWPTACLVSLSYIIYIVTLNGRNQQKHLKSDKAWHDLASQPCSTRLHARETPNLSTNADSSTDIFVSAGAKHSILFCKQKII